MMKHLSMIVMLALAGITPALAASGPVETGNTTAELVSEAAAAAPGEPFTVALKLTPRDGWHTYWRNPGDSGLPTTIEWTLPEGATAGDIQWPVPHAVPYGPLMNYGYKDAHYLMVDITAPADWPVGQPIPLQARADWLVCEEVCIPEGTDLSIEVPVRDGAMRDPRQSAGFRAARADLPVPLEGAAEYRLEEGVIVLRLADKTAGDLRFFPYTETLISNPAPQTVLTDADAAYVLAQLAKADAAGEIAGVVTFEDNGRYRGVAIAARPADFALPADVAASSTSGGTLSGTGSRFTSDIGIVQALLFAFLGGMILNLMPCVFPILSLKALSLVSGAQASGQERRTEGLAYTAGVVLSFLVIAGALLAFRAGGEAIGWGFQLQSPVFIAVLAILLFAVGLNLSGFYEISGRFAGIGEGLTAKKGSSGAFFTGVLATVVATPCTAPFMAPALGFALTQPVVSALGIFAALGLGLAFPFLLLTLVPALGRMLPKPGPWMERFKQFLAFPIYGTAIWLIWVLGQQAGMNAVAAVLIAVMLVPFVIWVWRSFTGAGQWVGRAAGVLAIVTGIWLVAFAGDQNNAAPSGAASTADMNYEAFDPALVAQYREEGYPVFVNFTAAWCITCLANERVALSVDSVKDHFQDEGIKYLKGDWTNRDPVITETLTAFGYSGVPLYLYYPRGAAEPIVLPQLLTPDVVLRELKAADRTAVASSD